MSNQTINKARELLARLNRKAGEPEPKTMETRVPFVEEDAVARWRREADEQEARHKAEREAERQAQERERAAQHAAERASKLSYNDWVEIDERISNAMVEAIDRHHQFVCDSLAEMFADLDEKLEASTEKQQQIIDKLEKQLEKFMGTSRGVIDMPNPLVRRIN